jgi:hypothetical protein
MQERQVEANLRIQELEAQNSLLQRRAHALEEVAAAARKESVQAVSGDAATLLRIARAENAELQHHIKLLHAQLAERSVCQRSFIK